MQEAYLRSCKMLSLDKKPSVRFALYRGFSWVGQGRVEQGLPRFIGDVSPEVVVSMMGANRELRVSKR